MNRISIRKIEEYLELCKMLNALPLSEIEWLDDAGCKIEMPEEEIASWKFTGLSNIDFGREVSAYYRQGEK